MNEDTSCAIAPASDGAMPPTVNLISNDPADTDETDGRLLGAFGLGAFHSLHFLLHVSRIFGQLFALWSAAALAAAWALAIGSVSS